MIRRVSSKGMSQDESAKNHIKDNNWRGIEIFPNADGVPNLYISKGGGGNGDNGIFQVLNGNFPNATLAQVVNGTGAGVPTGGSDNTIVQLLGNEATNPNTNGPSPLTPFAFLFAYPTTLYDHTDGRQRPERDRSRYRSAGRIAEMGPSSRQFALLATRLRSSGWAPDQQAAEDIGVSRADLHDWAAQPDGSGQW